MTNGSQCSTCQSYNKGKGTRACLMCVEFKDILPQGKPNPDIIRLPKELLENLNNPSKPLSNIFDLIAHLAPVPATMLLQSMLLQMTHREIAAYHQMLYSHTTCRRKISEAIEAIRLIQEKKI